MSDRIRFLLMRLTEKLWIKPLIVCLLSIAIAFIAQSVEGVTLFEKAPEVKPESIEMLLKVLSASMLVIAVFAVGSMLSAYQTASNAATPRSFTLVVADDISQNALSTFIGAFIFSIVAQVAFFNEYYGKAGRFLLFIITCVVFVLVILAFIRWVDRIARLGRVETIISKVEMATRDALQRRKNAPYFGGVKGKGASQGMPVYSPSVGYIQRIDMKTLQTVAEETDAHFEVASLPGEFVTPDKPLVYVVKGAHSEINQERVNKAFRIGKNRTFDDDPRFGLITLSEIGSRALSPAVNDPGTAIEIVGIYVRLFVELSNEELEQNDPEVKYDRVAVPLIPMADLFSDAFNAISRDGASTIEVVIRLLKAQQTLAALGDEPMQKSAKETARLITAHAEKALRLPSEISEMHTLLEICATQDADTSS